MRRILVVLGAVGLLGLMTGPAAAQESPPHDHWLTVPGTGDSVQVGPRRCDLGSMLQGAFLNFHFNVHVGAPMSSGGLAMAPAFCP